LFPLSYFFRPCVDEEGAEDRELPVFVQCVLCWDDGKEQQGTVNVDDSSKQLLKKSKDVNVNKVVKLKQSCSRRQESKYQSIKILGSKGSHSDTPSSSSFFDVCMGNVNVLLRNSVGRGSAITYNAGWNQWETFTRLFGTNLTLEIFPKEWFDSRLPYSFVETAIISTYTYGEIF